MLSRISTTFGTAVRQWEHIITRPIFQQSRPLSVLPQMKDEDVTVNEKLIYLRNVENMIALREKYNHLVAEAKRGGGEKGIQRHVERNKKMLARERVKNVLDADSPTIEIGTIAGYDMEYGNIASAGVVNIIGKVHGSWCMIVANDATVKGGSIYPITLKKQLRSQDIAREQLLPCIYLVDSGGAFLPLQSEIFNPGGQIFRNQAVMSSEGIPQIAFVCGSCTAGAAYIPTMAQEAVIQEKIGTIFLGGPPLVKAATGEVVTPEQLGGADLHSRLSGCTDHFVTSEYQGFDRVRSIVATSNVPEVDTLPIPKSEYNDFDKMASAHTEFSVSMYEIIKRLADDKGFHEYKEKYGNTLVAGFMFVNGTLVGVVGNNGYLTEKSAKKGANFVQLCSARHIPILFLQNITHDEVNESEQLRSDAVKTRATFMQAVAISPCPKMVISVGGLVGSPHSHAMCSLSMGARFHFVWPNVRLGAEFLWNSENESLLKYKEQKHKRTAFYGASQFWYDGIVLPEDTREMVYFCLNMFEQERKIRLERAINSSFGSSMVHTVLRL